MVAKTLEEAAKRGARTVDDVLTQMDAVIETAERARRAFSVETVAQWLEALRDD